MLLFVGCSATRSVKVPVESDPPGARIEVNNDYVGDAPTMIEMLSWRGEVARPYVIRAIPKKSGWTQVKVFRFYDRYIPSDPVPSRLFFDTELQPPPTNVNLNVDSK